MKLFEIYEAGGNIFIPYDREDTGEGETLFYFKIKKNTKKWFVTKSEFNWKGIDKIWDEFNKGEMKYINLFFDEVFNGRR